MVRCLRYDQLQPQWGSFHHVCPLRAHSLSLPTGVVHRTTEYLVHPSCPRVDWFPTYTPEFAIQPIQQFDIVKGKNATDMALLIDAMDILYTRDVDIFCLVSSDCDFTPLVLRLRAQSKKVIGFGRQGTPDPFVNACSHFIYLDEASDNNRTETKNISAQELKQNTKLMNTLRQAVKTPSDDLGWAAFGPVGSYISNQSPYDHRSFGFKKLSDLFAAIDLFEIKKFTTENGSHHRVRIKKQAVKKKTPLKKREQKADSPPTPSTNPNNE